MGAANKGKSTGKGKIRKTTPREETAYVGPRKADVHLEICKHSSMNRTRKARRRDDFVHFLRQVHHTKVRKVTEKVVFINTSRNLLMRNTSATVASYIPAHDERQMQLWRIESDDKTHFRVRLHHLANRYYLKGNNRDLHLEVPTFEESSVEWTLHMEEMARKAAWFLHKDVYKVPRSYSQKST